MEKEDIITVVIATKHTVEEKKEFLENIQVTCGAKMKIIYALNDGLTPLSQIYQSALSQAETEIIIFMHDDIEFLKNNWGKEIIRMFNEHQDYGIIGVAGSAEFDANAAWWNYSKIYGQVLHRNDGKSWLTAFSPLFKHDLEEVCVIDGLFMAVNKNRITQTFDTNILDFHMYDIDLCLANFLDGKTKVGVTTKIRIAHNSIGALDDKWYINRNYINSKYNNNYPISIKK
jgi:hypothetical protein